MFVDRATEVAWTHSSEDKLVTENAVRETPKSTDDVAPAKGAIVLIDKRALVRECLSHSIRSATGQDVISFPSVESWFNASSDNPASLIVICTGSSPRDVQNGQEALMLLSQSSRDIPGILLSDSEDDPDKVVKALEHGARGYIPTSVALDVAIGAMRLVRAGGTFVPASSLVNARRTSDNETSSQVGDVRLTPRQKAVVEALRRGKANKIIAYELNMQESTVKVHVRNIMRKFNATNRTEVAFKASEMFSSVGE
jgi:DNA-binding NarL/FixJ family response regulator